MDWSLSASECLATGTAALRDAAALVFVLVAVAYWHRGSHLVGSRQRNLLRESTR